MGMPSIDINRNRMLALIATILACRGAPRELPGHDAPNRFDLADRSNVAAQALA
jgi:hypothetical protein